VPPKEAHHVQIFYDRTLRILHRRESNPRLSPFPTVATGLDALNRPGGVDVPQSTRRHRVIDSAAVIPVNVALVPVNAGCWNLTVAIPREDDGQPDAESISGSVGTGGFNEWIATDIRFSVTTFAMRRAANSASSVVITG
jgi:hypothetical protein